MNFQVKPDLSRYPEFILPKRGSARAAGLDLFAQEDMVITDTTQLFDLGFSAAVPDGYVGIIVPRSGLGAKFHVSLSNTLGVIDSDYRGEWKAALHLGGRGTQRNALRFLHEMLDRAKRALNIPVHEEERALLIPKGDAFAQVLFFEVPLIGVEQVTSLDVTLRGEGGFGSTTKHISAMSYVNGDGTFVPCEQQVHRPVSKALNTIRAHNNEPFDVTTVIDVVEKPDDYDEGLYVLTVIHLGDRDTTMLKYTTYHQRAFDAKRLRHCINNMDQIIDLTKGA